MKEIISNYREVIFRDSIDYPYNRYIYKLVITINEIGHIKLTTPVRLSQLIDFGRAYNSIEMNKLIFPDKHENVKHLVATRLCDLGVTDLNVKWLCRDIKQRNPSFRHLTYANNFSGKLVDDDLCLFLYDTLPEIFAEKYKGWQNTVS